MTDESRRGLSIVAIAVLIEGGLALLALALGWLLDAWPLSTWNATPSALLAGLGAAVPLIPVFFACLRLRWPPLQRIRRFFDEVFRPIMAACTLLDLVLISVLAGLGEEMLFRGVLQAALARHLGPARGLVLASAVFGLMHAITLTYAIVAGLMGAYLGWLWQATGNLFVPAVAHAAYDFLALVYLLRLVPGPPGVEDGAGPDDTDPIIAP